jgi:hypothetical protein
MTGSSVPLESLGDRTKWLGGEAHVRYLGKGSLGRRAGSRARGSRLALALAFLAGGVIGAGLTGLVWRAQRHRRAVANC